MNRYRHWFSQTNKLFKTLVIVSFLFNSYSSVSYAQSLKDSIEVAGFAKFLFDEELYKFAAEEYERLTYFYPKEINHQASLIASYRRANMYERIKSKIAKFETDNPKILMQYLVAMLLNDDEEGAQEILKDKSHLLDPAKYNRLNLDLAVMSSKWTEADALYHDYQIKDDKYYEIIKQGTSIKKKNPALAGIMSTLVPGTGRVYAKDWKDGLISMAFIGMTSFQSYVRFNKKGIRSPGGWIYGGIGLGFYIANIVGSVQSARIFNKNQNKTLNAKAKSYIDRFYLD